MPVPFAMGPPGGDWAGSRGAAGTATSCYFLAPHPQQEHVPVLQQGAAGAQAHPCPPGLQPHSVLQQVLQQGSVMVVVVLRCLAPQLASWPDPLHPRPSGARRRHISGAAADGCNALGVIFAASLLASMFKGPGRVPAFAKHSNRDLGV